MNFSKEELKELYVNQRIAGYKIAKMYGVPQKTIYGLLKKYKFPMPVDGIRISKEELEELYINQRMTAPEIANQYNLPVNTIYWALQKYQIKRGYPWNKGLTKKEKPQLSNSGVKKGNTAWNKGLTKKIDNRVKKISLSKKGKKNPMYGKVLSEAHKKKIGTKSREQWKDPKYRDYILSSTLLNPDFREKRLKALFKRPTKPEQRLINIIKKYNLPFEYVADGSVIIYGLNPDFIECNGKKKIIEVFGDYWHTRTDIPWYSTEFGRKAIYSRLGYDTLIIWEHELISNKYGQQVAEEKIVEKIKRFAYE